MPVQHKDLTGVELHEPKGVATASSQDIYVADGDGSGTWINRFTDFLNINLFSVSSKLVDISTPSSFDLIVVPYKSVLQAGVSVLHGAITTADDIISFYKNGVLIAGEEKAIPFTGSAEGVKQALTFASVPFNAGDILKIQTNGASDTVTPVTFSMLFQAVT